MKEFQCKICKNATGNVPMVARYTQFGLNDEFTYFKCSRCGCVQIAELPNDLGKYYPLDKYYSYNKDLSLNFINRLFVQAYFKYLIPERLRKIPRFMQLQLPPRPWYRFLKKAGKNANVLDIGCGSGRLLHYLSLCGYQHLTGLDPFIEYTIVYQNGINIYKQSVAEHEGRYDIIMMHHSFEHIDNPKETLEHCNRLLSPNGRLVIRIPVSDSWAFRKYGVNWYGFCAPCHLFLHTAYSISLLAENAGFNLTNILYESTSTQIINRENSLIKNANLSFIKKICYRLEAERLNLLSDGDMACFVLAKMNKNVKI